MNAFLQPALIGGLVLGVLSALPLISGGNLCCCLWLVTGGVVAAYTLQQRQSAPITPSDGALAGLLAGIIGAFVYLVVSIPVALVLAPFERRVIERLVDLMPNAPTELRNYASGPVALGVRTLVSFIVVLLLGAFFSTLGGLLGAVLFAKKPPPAAGDLPLAP